MKQNLKDSITKWKRDKTAHNEFRSVQSVAVKTAPGEYVITLKMDVVVKYFVESERITLTNEVMTNQQAGPDKESENPNGDVHVFEAAAKKLVKDFEEKFQITYSKLWKSQTPDGFV